MPGVNPLDVEVRFGEIDRFQVQILVSTACSYQMAAFVSPIPQIPPFCYNRPIMSEEMQAENYPQKIVKTVRKIKIDEQPSDFAYWQTQPYAARLTALEDIRRAYIAWKYDTDPGFQRVYTIIKRS